MATADQPGAESNSELLYHTAESIVRGDNPDDDGNPPPYRATGVPEVYLLTPRAILAIANIWDVRTNCTSWLHKIQVSCERYGVPIAQRALCAMHHMRANCKEAAYTSECYNMMWNDFTAWIRKYDRKLRIPTLTGAPR